MENAPLAENQFAPANFARVTPPPTQWGVGLGVLTWFASVFFLFACQLVALIFYVVKTGGPPANGQMDWLLAMLSVASAIPAHLLTVLFCWFVVTGRGQGFWQALGWGWHPQFKWVHATALAFLMLGVAALCAKFLPHQETELEKILKMGQGIRILTAIMAVLSAPLVEEIVYRGVLFVGLTHATIRQNCILFGAALSLALTGVAWQTVPGFGLKRLGLSLLIGVGGGVLCWGLSELLATRSADFWLERSQTLLGLAVLNTATLFALVHVPQYWGSWAAITTIVLLSLVLTLLRAWTGSVLPGIATHFVYNGIQGVGLLLGLDDTLTEKTTQTAFSLGQQLSGWLLSGWLLP